MRSVGHTSARGWPHQIRSYVLDRNLVKDLRTGVARDASSVLDGDLDDFLAAALAQRVDSRGCPVMLEGATAD